MCFQLEKRVSSVPVSQKGEELGCCTHEQQMLLSRCLCCPRPHEGRQAVWPTTSVDDPPFALFLHCVPWITNTFWSACLFSCLTMPSRTSEGQFKQYGSQVEANEKWFLQKPHAAASTLCQLLTMCSSLVLGQTPHQQPAGAWRAGEKALYTIGPICTADSVHILPSLRAAGMTQQCLFFFAISAWWSWQWNGLLV